MLADDITIKTKCVSSTEPYNTTLQPTVRRLNFTVMLKKRMTPTRGHVLMLVAILVAGAMGYFAWTQRPVSSTDKLQVREALALHLFDAHGTGIWSNARYFLRIEGGDPSPALLNRLNSSRTVLPASESEMRLEVDVDRGVFHRESGQRGVLYELHEIQRVGGNRVRADAMFYPHPEGAEGYRCEMEEQSEDSWNVGSCQMTWIS